MTDKFSVRGLETRKFYSFGVQINRIIYGYFTVSLDIIIILFLHGREVVNLKRL